ncbi:Agenet-like domain [Macleaya cordata]|uniref:Agenet-like domain n=1 Tax=Macleaya cordata TaxID=56857 RepID=A0A200QT55_MACCD|nr:Agenet-like domain [Macleaya cordata]
MKKKFLPGDSVEISSKEVGFMGSYYEAIIVEPVVGNKNKYLVEYLTLITDDQKRYLREIVDATEIRPSPPKIPVSDFNILDQVDVFDNDGWWVGRITGRDLVNFYVYFDRSTGETLRYRFPQLRVHQEWENGKWVPSQKAEIYK